MPADTLEAPAAAPSAPAPSPQPTPTPAPTGTQSPVPSEPGGSDVFIQEMDAILNAPEKPAAQPKPPEKPTEPAKPEKPKEPEKPAPAKTEPAPVKEKDPVALRKRLAEIEAKYAGLEQTAANERRELQEKIAAFEKRKYLTKELEEQQAAVEKRAKELEAELYSRDYRESPEFKEKYEARWQRAYRNAVEEATSIQITNEEDGTTRTATESDFNAVLNAPKGQQRVLAKKLFGEDADVILTHRNTLKGIEESASEELRQSKLTYEQKKREREVSAKQFSEQFSQNHSQMDAALEQKYPEYFGNDPADTEAVEAMRKGLDFVDSTAKEADTLPVATRAARSALIRRWAGAFPRLVLLNRRLQAQLDEHKKTVSDLQRTDPGAAGGEGGSPKPTDTSGGIEALAKEFEIQ